MKYSRIALISASSFTMFGAAYAADLPSRKSSPVEYVKVCDVYGAGFFYIPGTDTCLKVGGRVRMEALYSPAQDAFRTRSVGGAGNATAVVRERAQDESGWRSRGWLTLDARTQSAWGTIQTVSSIYLTTAAGISTGANNYITGAFVSGNTPSVTLESAYIRFAGFTFGRARQNFATMPPFTLMTSYWAGFAVGNMQVAYTTTLGGGVSATIALEDNNGFQTTGTNTVGPGLTVGRAGQNLPSLVGNVRFDQPWGSLQLSGAVKRNDALVGAGAGQFEVGRTGWAVGGYARINLPMIAAGDRFDFTAAYGKGFMELVFTPGLNASVVKFGRHQAGGILRMDRDLTVINGAGVSEQTKGWSVGGIFTHYWLPSVRQHAALSYVRITPDTVTRASDILAGGLGRANGFSAQSQLIWSPVPGFDLGVELAYMRLNDKTLDTTGILAANGIDRDPGNWAARFRAERAF